MRCLINKCYLPRKGEHQDDHHEDTVSRVFFGGGTDMEIVAYMNIRVLDMSLTF